MSLVTIYLSVAYGWLLGMATFGLIYWCREKEPFQ